MKTLSETTDLDGYTLNRMCFLPEHPPRAAVVLLHGQGDYTARYGEVASLFQARGIAVVGTDLPGHGLSSGRRGHIPGFAYVDRVVEENRKRCRELAPGAPIGIAGHSCGGLMALRALFREPDGWNFSWISSPLVHPEGTRSTVEAWFLLMLSRIVPFVSVDSGVGPKECVTGDDKPKQDGRLSEDDEPNLFHRRITLGWAQEICETARWVRQQFAAGFPDIPALITQGGDDPVCRADTLRGLLESMPSPQPALEIIPGLRHEPFADPQKAIFLDLLGSFIDGEVISALPRRDRAGGT